MKSVLHLVSGLSERSYVVDKAHALLAQDAWKKSGPNIGCDGSNLTITFLSMNRATLSEKLLRSIQEHIPGFAGEVLIIDNGSSIAELMYLRTVCDSVSYKTRLVELGRNYGVAGGRNRTIPHVRTDWLMCLDNDIYFLSNPLSQFQQDLAMLGCHFMSLPLLDPDGKTLFARGGHLYVSYENGELHIGAGSACAQTLVEDTNVPSFLATFLFGGSCILNRVTFENMGGYDEAMFVGFEDIDFSIRLFQQGYKVGASGCCALVHDHPKPASDSDRDYERERFSREVLHKSALHLEEKHGFKIWSNAVDHWLESRHKELELTQFGVVHLPDSPSASISSGKKPKIALVIDTDHWAFGNISRQLQRYLSDRFEFTVIPMDIIDNIDQVLMMAEDCDLVHFFWREHLTLIGTPYYRSYVESLGMSYSVFEQRFIASKKISTSVYDHLLLNKEELDGRRHLFSDFIAGYTVGSEKLNSIYSKIPNYPKPAYVVQDGVDLSLFKPENLERMQGVGHRELVVGWVGNSKWASELEDFKGLHTILRPAVDELRAEGYAIRLELADRQQGFTPHDEMPGYYARIDVLACSSKIEGTPNPVLEAMACGVAVVSTDVGIVPEVFGERQRAFILEERSKDCMKDKLKSMVGQGELLQALSAENLESIRSWDWSIKAENFYCFFSSVLGRRPV